MNPNLNLDSTDYGCEIRLVGVFHNRNPSNLDSSDQWIRLFCDLNLNLDYQSNNINKAYFTTKNLHNPSNLDSDLDSLD